jgi:hypothetical protein
VSYESQIIGEEIMRKLQDHKTEGSYPYNLQKSEAQTETRIDKE